MDRPKNSYEMKKQINKVRQRFERFGGGEGEGKLNKGQERYIERMEKRLGWLEHKRPPAPILQNSTMLMDSLYLYGVDYMSTWDIGAYFKSYKGPEEEVIG